MKPFWNQPSHPDIFEVISQPGDFTSFSRAKRDFPPGALLARLTYPTLTLAKRAYSSVQVSPTGSIELNCDFLYINHSCTPSVEFHVSRASNDDSPSLSSSSTNSRSASTTPPMHQNGTNGHDAQSNDTSQTQQENQPHPYVIEIRVASSHNDDSTASEHQQRGLKTGDDLTFFYPSTEWEMDQPFNCNCKTAACKGLISGAKNLDYKQLEGYFVNEHIREMKEQQAESEK